MKSLRRHWFLVALALVLLGGSTWHAWVGPLAERIPQDALLAAIVLAMSAPLDLGKSMRGGYALSAVLVGVFVNAALAAPLAAGLAWLLGPPSAGVLSEGLAVGLVIAALPPTTQASAAVWTRRGGGNEAAALMVTVVTNLACFVVLPFWAWALLGEGGEAAGGAIDPWNLSSRLALCVVTPLVAGQLLRLWAPLRLLADRHRHGLSIFAQCGLLAMVAVGAVRCGEAAYGAGAGFGAAEVLTLVAAAAGLHTLLFAVGWASARALGAPRPEALAAAVGGSQKTLAVGLDVAISIGATLGLGGAVILPMVVYHAAQLLIDAVLVERVGRPKPGG
ncbi:MAG: bile acid:sodium symporter [Lacipirellulaceae bacterium]